MTNIKAQGEAEGETLGNVISGNASLKGTNIPSVLFDAFSVETVCTIYLGFRSLRSLTLGFISLSPLATNFVPTNVFRL